MSRALAVDAEGQVEECETLTAPQPGPELTGLRDSWKWHRGPFCRGTPVLVACGSQWTVHTVALQELWLQRTGARTGSTWALPAVSLLCRDHAGLIFHVMSSGAVVSESRG